ncbi:hypothetical protein FNV43_RR13191 [Rhamnella rubrinervis]|uniref:Pentatricopeptide repeat-containing protein n=1 Tax=Rhamnella rubrinervis TaxID=2594499 RepID=A0A8K0H0R7_9ROSA|nr:hypothetical protein FNV43_RR13191 [Rhamnella rubrinervis]
MASTALPLPISPSSPTTQTPNTSSPPSSSVSVPKPKTPTIRSRLSKLCQEGQPHLARQLFDTLPRPTTVLWNTIIIGFICNSFPNEALLFYAQMKKSYPRTKCDSYTYSSTLKACADTRNLRIGKAVHCHVLRCLSNPSRVVYNSLLNMYSTCLLDCDYSKYDVVRKVFDTMRRRNVVAWNTLVSCLAVDLARKIFDLCVERNTEVWNTMIGGCNFVDMSFEIFHKMLKRDVVSWNTMISSFVQNGLDDEALMLVYEMQKQGFKIDSVTVAALLSAASNIRNPHIGKQTHAYLIRHGIEFEGWTVI